MAEFKAAVEIDVKPSSGSTQSLKGFKAQLRELKLEAQQAVIQFGEFSPEALKAQQAVADLDDKMQDFNDRVKALNPDKFSKVLTITQGVTQGFQAAQGAMALFGSESEDLQKTLVKVQGAMALAQGLEGLGKIQQQFVAIGQTILGPVLNAFKAFGNGARAAIASTGIGILIVALGTIVAYWDDIKKALTGVNKETEKQTKLNQKNIENAEKELEIFEQKVNILKLQGKSEREIEQLRIKAIQRDIDEQVRQFKHLKATQQSQIDATKRNFEYVNTGLKLVYAPIYAMLKIIDLTRRAIGQQSNLANQATEGLTKMLFDPKATEEASNKELDTLSKSIRELESKKAASQLNIQKIDEEASKKSKENLDNRLKTEAQLQAELLALNAHTLEEKINAADAAFKIEADELTKQGVSQVLINQKRDAVLEKVRTDFYEKEKQDAEKRRADELAAQQSANEILIKFYDEYYAQQIINAKKSGASQQEIDALQLQLIQDKLTAARDANQETAALEEQLFNKKKEIADNEKKLNEERAKQAYDSALNGLNAISALNEAFAGKSEEEQKNAFEMDKSLKYASTVLSTIQGTVNAFKTAQDSVITGVFPAYPFVQAAAAAAFGIAQLKKISDTKFQSKSTPSVSGGASAPNANGVPNMAAPRIASSLPSNQLTQERKVYVTEGDISRVQRRVANNQMVSVTE